MNRFRQELKQEGIHISLPIKELFRQFQEEKVTPDNISVIVLNVMVILKDISVVSKQKAVIAKVLLWTIIDINIEDNNLARTLKVLIPPLIEQFYKLNKSSFKTPNCCAIM
jgi:hypothetical protein